LCCDIRASVGATSTLVTEYLVEQKVQISQRLATALFYGIESETGGHPRGATYLDDAALVVLFGQVDHDVLAAIHNARLPQAYFGSFLTGLGNSFIYDNLIVSWLGEMDQPDLPAELADFLLRFQEVEWAFCGGVYGTQFQMSLRSSLARARAGEVLAEVVEGLGSAGGHDKRAGGSIPLESTAPSAVDDLEAELRRRLLKALDIDERRGQRLVSKKSIVEGVE
jgi:nanoRNase/pAp phosphatase (c-di-AMP/oligoRNAs hydrolase)